VSRFPDDEFVQQGSPSSLPDDLPNEQGDTLIRSVHQTAGSPVTHKHSHTRHAQRAGVSG
jgi:hypothetical protein